MRTVNMTRFLGKSVLLLLVLMPVWYQCAAWLGKPVLASADWIMRAIFDWVTGVQLDGTIGVLRTKLRTSIQLSGGVMRVGEFAPKLDTRSSGYSLVILWALLLASWPKRLWLKLLGGTAAMLAIQVGMVCIQWLNDVYYKGAPEILLQVTSSTWMREVIAFLFHFNLYMLIPLSPVLFWFILDRDFAERLWQEIALPQKASE